MAERVEGARSVAVLTGASEGFGRQLAPLIAADGYDLVVIARNEARLVDLARELEGDHGVRVDAQPMDLADPEQQLTLAESVRQLPRLKLVVNNAAFSVVDRFPKIPIRSVHQMIFLNLAALYTLSHAALNNADFCRGGTLLNVGSIGGSWPFPLDAPYSSTKAAIEIFTKAVAYETARNPEVDVHVQIAKLGGLSTDWRNRAIGELKPGEKPDPRIEWLMNDPARAARSIWAQTRARRKRIVYDNAIARWSDRIFRVFPRLGSYLTYESNSEQTAQRTRK